MKRFSCLSAAALILSLTSIASADETTKPAQRTVQPSDQSGGTDPTAAPAAPGATATAAAPDANASGVSIGSAAGTPGQDTPANSASEPAPATKARRWAGTQIFGQVSMTTATVFKGQTQYNNPTVDSGLFITPRFAINDAWQLRGRVIFSYEFTNSDETVTKNEPRFSDTTISLFYRKIPELPGGIKPAAAFNLTAPTSPESRARTMILSPGATLQLAKTIEHIPGNGELDLLFSTSYSHPFYSDTTPGVRGSTPYAFSCAGGGTCQDQLSGAFNMSDQITYSGLIAATWGKWSPALYYNGASQWTYTGSDVTYLGRPVDEAPGVGRAHIRQNSYFSAWLDYEANTWLTAEVGYSLSRSLLSGDATYGNPFFDRYQDSRVYLGANFNIDNIMKQLEGGPTEAGIVRAQNKKPVMTPTAY